MNNQMPGSFGPNMPNMSNPFYNEQMRNLEQRVNRMERDIRRLDGRVNRLEQSYQMPYGNENPNSKYQTDSYNMF